MSAQDPVRVDGASVPPDPLEAARALRPQIEQLATTIEEQRRLPAELVDRFAEAGLFHLVVPRSYGGSETNPVVSARVVEEVSVADGSAGWCLMVAAQHAALGGVHGRRGGPINLG